MASLLYGSRPHRRSNSRSRSDSRDPACGHYQNVCDHALRSAPPAGCGGRRSTTLAPSAGRGPRRAAGALSCCGHGLADGQRGESVSFSEALLGTLRMHPRHSPGAIIPTGGTPHRAITRATPATLPLEHADTHTRVPPFLRPALGPRDSPQQNSAPGDPDRRGAPRESYRSTAKQARRSTATSPPPSGTQLTPIPVRLRPKAHAPCRGGMAVLGWVRCDSDVVKIAASPHTCQDKPTHQIQCTVLLRSTPCGVVFVAMV